MKTASTLLRAGVISAAVAFALLVGCQIQREGERCSLLNGDHDCEEGLVCTAASSLSGDDGVNRCCPDSGSVTDERCRRRVGGSGGMGGDTGGGSGGGGNLGGSTSSGGSSGIGAACEYRSDCESGLTCGPGGKCQYECQDDIDCADGLVCSEDRRCTAP